MACVSAAGDHIPPMFIFPGINRQQDWMEGAVDGAVCSMFQPSNINGFLYLHWLKLFDKEMTKKNVQRPFLLILDGHFSHISGVVVNYAKAQKIKLFVLPSHTSHFTQPLDNKVFSVLKRNYDTLLSNFPIMFGRPQPTKHDLVRLVSLAWTGFVEPMNFAPSFTRLRVQKKIGGDEHVETLPDRASRKWTGAISPEFCQESIKITGIFPLSVDVMLNKIIGSEPVVADMPAINFLVQTPVLTERQERHLNRQGISLQSLDAAFLGFQQLLQLIPHSQTSQAKAKRQRAFIEGGALMTRDEMIASVLEAKEARREKTTEKVKKAKEREIKKKLREKAVTLKKIQQIEKKAARKDAAVLKQAAQKEAAARKRVAREEAAAKIKIQQLEKNAARYRLAAGKKAVKVAKAHKKSLCPTKLFKTSLSTSTNDVAELEETSEPIQVNLHDRDAQSLLLLASAAGFDVAM